MASTIVTGAREEIISRIRHALRDVPPGERPGDVVVSRDYRRRAGLTSAELVQRFTQRLRDYHAEVRHVAPAEVGGALTRVCAELELRSVAVPEGLPRQWRPDGVQIREDRGLSAGELDLIDGAVTGCAVAIAETGTLVLDGQRSSGRRVLTLVPDHHVCVVTVDQILAVVPQAIAALEPAVAQGGLPVTFISGPSASSDIELERVEGVHGPRHLVVVIAGGEASSRSAPGGEASS